MTEEQRIPKNAHYVWIGGAQQSDIVRHCIDSFRKFLPDYEIICWDNERSQEVFREFPYAREAFEAGVYAFASDVIRLYALKTYGGVYLDSDVELFTSLDPFLKHAFFSGFQDEKHAITAVMGSERNGEFVSQLLDDYRERRFLGKAGADFTTNTKRIHNMLLERGVVEKNMDQHLPGGIAIYRREVFCPFHPKLGGRPGPDTVAMHHFNGSWLEAKRADRALKKRQKRVRHTVALGLVVAVAGLLFLLA